MTFRSEDMVLMRMFVQPDNAWNAINSVGLLDSFHFLDLSKQCLPHELTYIHQIKQMEECERRLQ